MKDCYGDISGDETPITVMKYKKLLVIIVQLSVLSCYLFFSFGTIIPYLTTGEFTAIWPSNSGSTAKKEIFYYCSWVFWLYSPTTVQLLRVGDVTFYNRYVEIRPFLFFMKKRVLSYELAYAKKRGERAIVLAQGRPGNWYTTPYNYWKSVYWCGIVVTMMDVALINPDCLPLVRKIVEDKIDNTSEF